MLRNDVGEGPGARKGARNVKEKGEGKAEAEGKEISQAATRWPIFNGEPATAQAKACVDWQVFWADYAGRWPVANEQLPSLPRVVYSPYRICPLGAHLDHQYGPVLAGAINHGIHLAYSPMPGHMYLRSDEFGGDVDFSINTPIEKKQGCWANYARGAVMALKQHYDLSHGLAGVTVGGRSQAGLSSSAAVGIAYLSALAQCNDIDLSDEELVRLDKYIETQFLGLKNGILDPAAVVFGRRDSLIEIDTRTYATQMHKAGGEFDFVLVHSGLQEALTPANFNQRVDESLAAADSLANLAGLDLPAPRLGDIPNSAYTQFSEAMTDTLSKRARHFFTERERVFAGIQAWQMGDAEEMGRLMYASSLSSIENYECGSGPVRELVGILNECPYTYGARFCGPGFRGCSLVLCHPGKLEEMVLWVSSRYAQKQPSLAEKSWVLRCNLVQGAAACEQ